MEDLDAIIKKANPKPKFNLDFYTNEDFYSEGDIENITLDLIEKNEPEDYVKAIYNSFSWPTYYHLTPVRKNILNWYDFKPDADVLEIGCGMGAITGTLCDRVHSVTAVELSKRRATATLLRCRQKENLEIIVGNLNDIEFSRKFDYITLIGVLEYQGSYTNSDNPFHDFLVKVRSLLKDDGKLLIAIENQYGLKYWCGAPEDHTAVPFEGLNQYGFSGEKVRTFSKSALTRLVKGAGFSNTFFYYPLPDYKLPTTIYSQEYLPKNGNLNNTSFYYYPDRATTIAQEENIYDDIISNGCFEFFANSFLVECSNVMPEDRVIFATNSTLRRPEYNAITAIHQNGKVTKTMAFGASTHLKEMHSRSLELRERGLNTIDEEWTGTYLATDFTEAQTLEDLLLEAYENGSKDRFFQIWDIMYDNILHSSQEAADQLSIIERLNIGSGKFTHILERGILDLIPRNAFYIDNEIYWYDQEWELDHVPATYILYRGIKEFYNSFIKVEEFVTRDQLYSRYDISEFENEYGKLEAFFFRAVVDTELQQEMSYFCRRTGDEAVNNINKILGPKLGETGKQIVQKYDAWETAIKQLGNYYRSAEAINSPGDKAGEIWFCWLQGLEQAPDLVKSCYRQLEAVTDKKINLITAENINQYIHMPDFIIDKWENKIISNTHFSDLIRLELLTQHGGIWIDSTVLITDEKILKATDDQALFCPQHLMRGEESRYISASNWFIASDGRSRILADLKASLYNYWGNNNQLIDYFLFHLMFTICKEKHRDEWGTMPIYSNVNAHLMQAKLSDGYSESLWKNLLDQSDMHKLTYKLENRVKENRDNIYNYICSL